MVNTEIEIDDFLKKMKKQGIKVQVEKLPDGRLKASYCDQDGLCFVSYFHPRYFSKGSRCYSSEKFNSPKVPKPQRDRVYHKKVDQKEVFEALKEGKQSHSQIAKRFNISQTYVCNIKKQGDALGW